MNLLPTVSLPVQVVAQSLDVLDTILNHSSRMKEIDNSYKLAKKQMDYSYNLEVKKLENDIEQFKEMMLAYNQNSQYQHVERMSFLDKAHELSLRTIDIDDAQKSKFLSSQIEKLLNMYEQNSNQNSNILEHSRTLLAR